MTSNSPKTADEWSLNDKVVVITGATDGIGKETARQLTLKGANLVLVGRSPDKTMRVADELQLVGGDAKNPTQNRRPEVFIADLSKCIEVKKVALQIKSRFPSINILINNAGGFFEKRLMSEDGFEMTFALNHLSYFLLTHHLLGPLKSGQQARIINVASEAHRRSQLDWDDLQAQKTYHGFKAYQRSKLANILFTNALARRLAGTGVTANSLHPGFVASKFGHNNSGFSSSLFKALQFFARSESKGAETSIYLAESATVTGLSGQYFIDCKPKSPSDVALDHETQERLWSATEDLLKPLL
jgi:NAD(P)-dependent dehydrogenase (short-subunit alcohol dehydrogenase family)